MANKGRSERNLTGGFTHYDEHGKKVGRSDPNIFGSYTVLVKHFCNTSGFLNHEYSKLHILPQMASCTHCMNEDVHGYR